MRNDTELRGIIHTRFRSEAEFARAVGWSRQKMNKITTGKQLPNIMELNKMAEMLDVSIHNFLKAFLPEQETKRERTALQEMDRVMKEQAEIREKCQISRREGQAVAALDHTFALHGIGGDGMLYSGRKFFFTISSPYNDRAEKGRMMIMLEFVPDDK